MYMHNDTQKDKRYCIKTLAYFLTQFLYHTHFYSTHPSPTHTQMTEMYSHTYIYIIPTPCPSDGEKRRKRKKERDLRERLTPLLLEVIATTGCQELVCELYRSALLSSVVSSRPPTA